jgi:hypothetical protein
MYNYRSPRYRGSSACKSFLLCSLLKLKLSQPQVHKQHAYGVRVSDSGLLLLHGSESAFSSGVSLAWSLTQASLAYSFTTGSVSVLRVIILPVAIHIDLPAILKINGEKLLQIQDDGGFLQ